MFKKTMCRPGAATKDAHFWRLHLIRAFKDGQVQSKSRVVDDGPVVHELGMKWPTSRWMGFKKVEIFERGEQVCLRVETGELITRLLIGAVIFIANGFWWDNGAAFFGAGLVAVYIAAAIYFLNTWRIGRWWRGLRSTLD